MRTSRPRQQRARHLDRARVPKVQPPPGMDKALPTDTHHLGGTAGRVAGRVGGGAERARRRAGHPREQGPQRLGPLGRGPVRRASGTPHWPSTCCRAEGGTAKFTDPAQATAALGKIPPEQLVANIKSGIDELQRRVPGKKLAAVGFCMGGGLVWQTAGLGRTRIGGGRAVLRACTRQSRFRRLQRCCGAWLLRCARSTRDVDGADRQGSAREGRELVHELVTEPDANHAFFNDTGDRYNATAAADAWRRVQDWFGKYLV